MCAISELVQNMHLSELLAVCGGVMLVDDPSTLNELVLSARVPFEFEPCTALSLVRGMPYNKQ